MELAFESKSLRTICESQDYAKQEFGSAVAEILKHRLADLRAATSIDEIVMGRVRPLDSVDNQQMVIDLCDGYRIVFSANHPKNPVAESGKIDWPKISRIKILRIENDHV